MPRGRKSPIPALLVGLFVIVGLCCSAVVAGAQTTTTTGKSGSSTESTVASAGSPFLRIRFLSNMG